MAKEEVDKIILDNLIFFSFVLFCSATKMTRKFWHKTKLVREKYEFAFNRKSTKNFEVENYASWIWSCVKIVNWVQFNVSDLLTQTCLESD